MKYETRYLFTLPLPSAPSAADQQVEPEAHISFNDQDDAVSIGDSSFGVINVGDEDIAAYNIGYPVSIGDPEFGANYDREDGIPPYEMLDAIGNIVRRLNIVRVIEVGTTLDRVRVHDATEQLTKL